MLGIMASSIAKSSPGVNDRWLVSGDNANYTYTSNNGSTWTTGTFATGSKQWWVLRYGNGFYTAIETVTSNVNWSADGITWTAGSNTSANITGGIYGGNTLVGAANTGSTNAVSSTDGKTFTARTLANAAWSAGGNVAYGAGTWVVVPGDAVSKTLGSYSTNGTSWTSMTMPSSKSWYAAGYGNGIFLAVVNGTSSDAATSTDGITWTARTLPTSGNTTTVAGNSSRVFAFLASSTSASYTANGGANWTTVTMPSTAVWLASYYANSRFLVAAYGTEAATSPDGTTWTARTMSVSMGSRVIAYG